jgi:hypothetical protein
VVVHSFDKAYKLKRMYERGFTRIVKFYVLSSAPNRANSPLLVYLFSMPCLASFSALLSFHSVLFVDASAHWRLGDKVGVPLAAFTAGNLLVHGLPCVMAVVFPPQQTIWHHGVETFFAAWGLCSTGGTLLLDDIYAHNEQQVWHCLWAVAQVVNVGLPFAWNFVMGEMRGEGLKRGERKNICMHG